jgi:hypothetical protein
MKKNLLFFVSMLFLLALIFAVFSCSVEKRAKRKYLRAVQLDPSLIDSVTTSDTVVLVDSITIHTTNTIRETEIDSIIVDCPDAVKPAIRKQIKDRCTIESLLNGAHIFRLTNGTGVLTASGNDPQLRFDSYEIRTENTVYIPNEKCWQEMKEYKETRKKAERMNLFIAFCIGFVTCLFAIIALRRGLR